MNSKIMNCSVNRMANCRYYMVDCMLDSVADSALCMCNEYVEA